MPATPRGKRSSASVLLILLAAAALWGYEQWQKRKQPATPPAATRREAPATPPEKQAPATPPRTAPTKPPVSPASKPAAVSRTGPYETYRGCTLAEDRGNDGDSFKVRLPDGRVETFRLYFVDTPESAFRRYRSGETNHARIRDQAADIGNITPEQAVEIGQQAKHFTLGLLAAAPFTLYTVWDSPYDDNRYHAFFEVKSSDTTRWLHELLVERGLCRIRTKPADLPDGTRADEQKAKLRRMEGEAKRKATGAWGL